jgi:hypothetical protein
MSFPGWCGLGIKPDIIIYFCLLHNQRGRFKIINTIGHVLCVILFMNGFMPSMLIMILIFLRSFANLGFRESIFHHCVASVGCLIIPASCLCFSLCHHNNSDSFVFKLALQMRNDRKVPKHLFRPALSSVAIVVITAIFPMIESVNPKIGHFSRSSFCSPQYRMQSFLHAWIFSTSKPNRRLSVLPHKRPQELSCLGIACP